MSDKSPAPETPDPEGWKRFEHAVDAALHTKPKHREGKPKTESKAKPIFTPRELKDWSGWFVVVQWPNGREQHVNGFGSEAAAISWIADESAAWLASG